MEQPPLVFSACNVTAFQVIICRKKLTEGRCHSAVSAVYGIRGVV